MPTAFDLSAYLAFDEEAAWGGDRIVDGADASLSSASGAFDPACAVADTAEPSESLEGLLKALPQYRRLLLDVILMAATPQNEAVLHERIAQVQKTNRSVYSPDVLCILLERAGALKRVDECGNEVVSGGCEPNVVAENGETYFTVAQAPVWLWKATEEGLACAQADDPIARLHDLFNRESEFKTVYRYILEVCDVEEGIAMNDLNAAVNALPEVSVQNLRAGHFVDELERCDAIAWDKAWRIADIGRTALASLREESFCLHQ